MFEWKGTLTVCVTCAGAVDGEAVQPEKWKGVENCLRLPQNPQRQVHALLVCLACARLAAEKTKHRLNWLDFTRTTIFYKPDFVLENKPDLKERQSRELAETHAKNWFCKTVTLPEKTDLAKKPNPNLSKLLLKTLKPILETWLYQRERKPWKMDFAKWNRLLARISAKTLNPILETWANMTQNFLNQKHEPIFKPIKFGNSPPLKDLTLTNQNFC